MPYINRSRPSHYDRTMRSDMSRRADTLEAQRDDFYAFMENQRLDEATIDREMRRFDEVVNARRQAADQDES